MPSPFPGMDPFLEDPEIFPDLHDRLIVHMSEAMQAQLQPPYYAAVKARIWMDASTRSIEPDVDIFRRPEKYRPSDSAAATGLLLLTTPLVFELEEEEFRETYIDILRRERSGDRLVTSVEVLSPSNKSSKDKGRKQYLRKQKELLGSGAHLVEIDLLRGGQHTTSVPGDYLWNERGRPDYHVSVRLFADPIRYHVYPILVRDPLPVVAIPLLSQDGQIALDLQALLTRCYNGANYAMRADYEHNRPVPPLKPKQAAWATRLLREKGLLPARKRK